MYKISQHLKILEQKVAKATNTYPQGDMQHHYINISEHDNLTQWGPIFKNLSILLRCRVFRNDNAITDGIYVAGKLTLVCCYIETLNSMMKNAKELASRYLGDSRMKNECYLVYIKKYGAFLEERLALDSINMNEIQVNRNHIKAYIAEVPILNTLKPYKW